MPESSELCKVLHRHIVDPLRRLMQPLSRDDECALGEQIDRSIIRLLPVLGPVFGASIILFGGWDYWIDAAQIL